MKITNTSTETIARRKSDITEALTMDQFSCMFADMDFHYKCLLGTLPAIVYTLDEKGHFTYVSDSIQSLGYTREQLLGSHFSCIIHSDDIHAISRDDVLPLFTGLNTGPQRTPKLFDERRSFNRRTADLEVRFIPKDSNGNGDVLSGKVYSSGQYIQKSDDQSVFCGTVGVITDLKKNNREQAHSATSQATIVSSFLKTMSHDFNNILTALYGNVQLLQLRAGKSENDPIYATIQENLERAARLVRRLGSVT